MPHAIVIGSGPNGLAAAIELATVGWSVTVYEAEETVGGGMRTKELTLPGFRHDICSAIHPMGISSPVFGQWPLERYGLQWVQPDLPLAHPFDDGTAAVLARSFDRTTDTLGADGRRWRRLFEPFAQRWQELLGDVAGPLRMPQHPLLALRFGMRAVQSATGLAGRVFHSDRSKALFAGLAAHSIVPLEQMPTAAIAMMLGIAGHAVGWPLPRGGSQSIADALAGYLQDLGGEIVTGRRVHDLGELPGSDAVLFDLTPQQVLAIARDHLPSRYVRALERYRYGPGVFKVDYALSEPVPWLAESCRRAGTVHLGGTMEEIAASEREVWAGRVSTRPYVLVAQQSLFDAARTPDGRHTLWAYCHVPSGSDADVLTYVENQIERFAPGFRDTVLRRHTMTARQMQRYNANYIGGDVNGGVQDLAQLLTRPVVRWDPYSTPNERLFICSASTPPGGGVHGLCGYHAARSVLRRFS